MHEFLSFISQHYLAVCICLLAVPVAVLTAAVRTKKDILFLLSAAASVLSAVLTFRIPTYPSTLFDFDYMRSFAICIFCILDLAVLIATVAIRAGADNSKTKSAFWGGAWITTVLGVTAMLLHVLGWF